jgi:hypothetical protein
MLLDCPHCSTRVLPMAGRLCPACRKNVDSPADPKLKPKPADEGVSRLEAEQKREGIAPPVKFETDLPGSGEGTIVPATSWKAIQKGALSRQTYEEVPWHRREPGALVFLAVLLCTPVTVVLCIIALTGDVYRNAYDEHGTLQVWGPGNKVAADLILLIQCFFIWALIMLG